MAKCHKYIGFNDLWLRVVGVPALGFVIPMVFFGDQFITLAQYTPKWIEASIFSFVYWEGSRLILIYLRRRYQAFEDTRKRIWLQFLAVAFHMNIVCVPLGLLLDMTGLFPVHEPLSGQLIAVNVTTMLIFLSIYESIYFYDQLKNSITEQERLQQESIRSQLEGLRNQVNPHFLFNSLNTLMSIVAEDQNLATRYLKKLSSIFRYVLDIGEKKLVSLEEELRFIRAYMFVQQERFGDNLSADINVPKELGQYKIVPLALQILFENAIKHNIISSKKPLYIEVFTTEDNQLIVRNNLQKKRQAIVSTRVGLENIRNRYRFFTEAEVRVHENDQYFEVAIPLLKI